MTRQSEIEVFTREFLAYRPVLARTVARILRCGQPEVDDVLQDVWIRGAATVARSGIQHPKAWLGRTAINAALDRLRDARRSPFAKPRPVDGEDPRRHEPADHRPGPYDQLALAREIRDLVQAIRNLPAAQQEVLINRFVDAEPFADIAARTGAPVETIRSRMFRAFAALRASLGEEKQAA